MKNGITHYTLQITKPHTSSVISNSKLVIAGITIVSFFGILIGSVSAATTTNNRGLEGVTYTQRADWGADENRRLTSRSEYQKILAAAKQFAGGEEDEPTESEKRNTTATDYVLKFFLGEFKVDRVVTGKGKNSLWWPNKYRIKKTKILVHHTADNNKSLPETVAQEKEYMKNLYRYHAFSRGWGDIGYNFVVMPSGRIYEGKAGGAGIIGAHATWNNTPSVGISLVGNFEEKDPTQEQIDSLTTLATSVSKKYGINPLAQTNYFKSSSSFPYIKVETHDAIAGHRDAGSTACPGEKLYALLPSIRKTVAGRLGISNATATIEPIVVPTPTVSPVLTNTQLTNSSSLSTVKNAYIAAYGFTPSKSSIKRLDGAPKLQDISTILKKPIPVLLYDASTTLDRWDLSCAQGCTVRINSTKRTATNLSVAKKGNSFAVTLAGKTYTTAKFAVSSQGIITMTNYTRKSGTIALNTFKDALLFVYGPIKKIDQEPTNDHHIINVISFDTYMKGIGEASDSQSQTKANVLALLAKSYILYYAGGTIKHPSIPTGALYVITDDPRISQKYNGAGREGLGKKRTLALQQTKGVYVTYKGVLPILPYFHCSAGFTWSAQEKRGRQDTPYLLSVADTGGKCESGDFEGHGIGLSGDGASKMADAGKSVKEIIEYYYPGTEISYK